MPLAEPSMRSEPLHLCSAERSSCWEGCWGQPVGAEGCAPAWGAPSSDRFQMRCGFLGQNSSGCEQDLQPSSRPTASLCSELPPQAVPCRADPQHQGSARGRWKWQGGMGKEAVPAGGNAPAHTALHQRVTAQVCSFGWLSGLGRRPVLPFLCV